MLVRKTTVICALALITAVSCNESRQSQFERKVADYALVEIETPDLSDISDNFDADLMNLAIEKIPADIRFK